MRAFKIYCTLMTAVLTGHILNLTAIASDEGALVKTPINSQRTSSVLVLPHGVMVGEFDARAWNYPYNGLFFSQDLGQTWERPGLSGRGITDVAANSSSIFICTYYRVDSELGLFVSLDGGDTFYHTGPDFSCSQVESVGNHVLMGGYSHGLWLSSDNGQTWQQKIGDGSGWTGPNITHIRAEGNLVLVSTPTTVYKSTDLGASWQKVEPLYGQQISSFSIEGSLVLAGTNNNRGLFRSDDLGVTWQPLSSWAGFSVGGMVGFKNTIYAQKIDLANQTYEFMVSYDKGESWFSTGLDPGQAINDSALLFSYPARIFMSTQTDGLYSLSIPQQTMVENKFLRIPWANTSENELLDKITAYFDHQYPLLGYTLHPEPAMFQDTTANFFGFHDNIYTDFYSSHNGIDFALPYGSEVLASAPGLASYYSCSWCGYSIRIDHQNGYQTTYMHMQSEDLVVSEGDDPVWVDYSTVLGKVGMSGRTTGPHLHFSVMFDNDYPDGLVDPFSWQDPYNQDPWASYSWQDTAGEHSGTSSQYLWERTLPRVNIYISGGPTPTTLALENKTIEFDLHDFESNLFTASLINFFKPYIPFSQYELEYIENTSFSITGKDHYEEDVVSVDGGVTLTIDLADLDLSKVAQNTLKIFFWDPLLQKWEPLPTIIDHVNNKLSAETTHLSHYAVLGEKLYPNPPLTTLATEGAQTNGWFSELPLITLSAQDFSGLGIKNIYYSLSDGFDWESYAGPFILPQDGITTLMFRADDATGNLEPANNYVIKVDTKDSWKDSLKVISSGFNITND